jgi:hypothetical protein
MTVEKRNLERIDKMIVQLELSLKYKLPMCIRLVNSGEPSEEQRLKLCELAKEHKLKLSIYDSLINIDPAGYWKGYASTCTKLLSDVTTLNRRGRAYNIKHDEGLQEFMPQIKQFIIDNALKMHVINGIMYVFPLFEKELGTMSADQRYLYSLMQTIIEVGWCNKERISLKLKNPETLKGFDKILSTMGYFETVDGFENDYYSPASWEYKLFVNEIHFYNIEEPEEIEPFTKSDFAGPMSDYDFFMNQGDA